MHLNRNLGMKRICKPWEMALKRQARSLWPNPIPLSCQYKEAHNNSPSSLRMTSSLLMNNVSSKCLSYGIGWHMLKNRLWKKTNIIFHAGLDYIVQGSIFPKGNLCKMQQTPSQIVKCSSVEIKGKSDESEVRGEDNKLKHFKN